MLQPDPIQILMFKFCSSEPAKSPKRNTFVMLGFIEWALCLPHFNSLSLSFFLSLSLSLSLSLFAISFFFKYRKIINFCFQDFDLASTTLEMLFVSEKPQNKPKIKSALGRLFLQLGNYIQWGSER